MENYTTGTGQHLRVHSIEDCAGVRGYRHGCAVHARLDTHMKDWPTHWRSDWGGFMEVICPHGIGHPAPEETRSGGFGHGCDGCCTDPAKAVVVPQDTVRYSQGGLMRCCIQTLTNEAKAGNLADAVDGDKLPCFWCQCRMVLDRGVWKWDKTRSWYTPEAKQA
jgi:hypothetical protein